jgi:hypothetical protein
VYPVSLAPVEKLLSRARIRSSRVFVADVDSEELDETKQPARIQPAKEGRGLPTEQIGRRRHCSDYRRTHTVCTRKDDRPVTQRLVDLPDITPFMSG